MLDNTDFNFDLDGDGVLDSFASEADLDGDGIADAFSIDSNGDGIEDAMVQELDLTGDGIPDGYQIGLDTDVNGILDTFTNVLDSDIDGVMDSTQTFYDPDEDGVLDYAEVDQFVDTDDDSQLDTLIHGVDEDIDGVIDSYETYDYEDIYGDDLSFDNVDIEDDSTGGLLIDELDNFDPSEANPDDIYGDPDEAMAEWEFQGDTNRCALYSQKFIIDEMTGQDVDIEEIADLAEENGWFSENGGTNLLDMNRVLDHYGVENEMSFGNDLDDLRDCLEGGGKAVRGCQVRVVRDGIIIADDKIAGLKRFKDDAKEVAEGYECGISLEKFSDVKEGDIFETYMVEEYRED